MEVFNEIPDKKYTSILNRHFIMHQIYRKLKI